MDLLSENEAVLFFVSIVNLSPWQQTLNCLFLLIGVL